MMKKIYPKSLLLSALGLVTVSLIFSSSVLFVLGNESKITISNYNELYNLYGSIEGNTVTISIPDDTVLILEGQIAFDDKRYNYRILGGTLKLTDNAGISVPETYKVGDCSSGILICNGTNLTFSGTTIDGNISNNKNPLYAMISIINGEIVFGKGSVLQNCQSSTDGTVGIYNQGKFTLDGGKITNITGARSTGGGGCIFYISNGAGERSIVINSGSIENSTVGHSLVYTTPASKGKSKIFLNGGSLGNINGDCFVEISNNVEVYLGSITAFGDYIPTFYSRPNNSSPVKIGSALQCDVRYTASNFKEGPLVTACNGYTLTDADMHRFSVGDENYTLCLTEDGCGSLLKKTAITVTWAIDKNVCSSEYTTGDTPACSNIAVIKEGYFYEFLGWKNNNGNFYDKNTVLPMVTKDVTYTAQYNITKIGTKNFTVEIIGSHTYSGKAITPDVTVKNNNRTLVKGVDYSVSYSENINAGSGTVIINGMGKYSSIVTEHFRISPKSLKGMTIDTKDKIYEYNGSKITPKVSISGLQEDIDYKVTYENNINAGTGSIIVTGIKNYTGTLKKDFTINRDAVQDLSWGIEGKSFVYSGKAFTPQVKSLKLVLDKDYTLEYINNVNVGTGIVKINGIGNYQGELRLYFDIFPKDLTDKTLDLEYDSVVYSNKKYTPNVFIQGLATGKDFTVSYSDNVNIGTAKVTVTGIGNYQGTITKTFKITIGNIADTDLSLTQTFLSYTGNAIEPMVASKTLKANIDYTVEYLENVQCGTGYAKITGINCYSGSVLLPFTILKNIPEENEFFLEYTEAVYNGKSIQPKVICTSDLLLGTDYEVEYRNNINAGTACAVIKGKTTDGNWELVKTFKIKPKPLTTVNIALKKVKTTYTGKAICPDILCAELKDSDYTVTYSKNKNCGTGKAVIKGIGNYSGTVTLPFKIIAKKGSVYTVGNYKYKVTNSVTNGSGTVTLCGSAKKTAKVTVPKTVTIGSYKYKVTAISASAFKKNTKITALSVGNNVKTIGNYSFYSCKNLKTVTVGTALTTIGQKAFANCGKLTKVTIASKKVKSLGTKCFYGDKKLAKITVKNKKMPKVASKALKGTKKGLKISLKK